ncbi:phosphotransferase family protein [Rhodococcus sp. Q]|uniref:phosphotransferase family protein n=1 Tax=Rhodococcus sp. Q TaxID=2502252 RepID=UPI0010F4DBCB|nr:phosphotransferase family protein [Rhodococcus sp. Q]
MTPDTSAPPSGPDSAQLSGPDSAQPADPDFAQLARPGESRKDPEHLRIRLRDWLESVLHADATPEVTSVEVPAANGMSNETILFNAVWTELGIRAEHRLVARIAPADSAVPLFPIYDLDRQYRVMRTVAAHSPVPVPAVYWSESSPEPLGGAFFVMGRLDGDVPPDVMPYTFGSWLSEAPPEARRRLQDASVRVLADLHTIDAPDDRFALLRPAGHDPDAPLTAAAALRAHIRDQRDYYRWATADGPRSPLIERALDWVETNMPEPAGPAVLCWGDSRIGNIMYRDFEPVAVLDWEMAALGPRELDLGWMIYLHRFFDDLAALAGLPGLPDLLRPADVTAHYLDRTGHHARDLEFHTLYAALRHAIVMFRVQTRTIAFGQAPAPADPDDMILHRATLTAMLDGTYWPGIGVQP